MLTQNFQCSEGAMGPRGPKILRRDQLPLKTNAPLSTSVDLHLDAHWGWVETVIAVYILEA